MRSRGIVTLAALVVLVTPMGVTWAQTASTTSSTTTTSTAVPTSTTTTTLPICFPGNPGHQVGMTCQLPGLECIVPNPPPGCGNFATPTGGDGGVVGATVTADSSADPNTDQQRQVATARPARLSLTG